MGLWRLDLNKANKCLNWILSLYYLKSIYIVCILKKETILKYRYTAKNKWGIKNLIKCA